MEIRSYNAELAYANILFSRLFNNIIIERKIGNKIKQIPVKCVIGNRSRIFKNLENPDRQSMYKLPMIIIQRTGINKNTERLANLHNEIKRSIHSSRIIYDLLTPVPIDISYSVTIVSKYPLDIDMILSNFIPFFNGDLFVTYEHPKFTNLKYNSQVVMDSSISEEHPDELDPAADDIITATCSFIFKTCIFAGVDKRTAGVFPPDTSSIVGPSGEISSPGFIPIITKICADFHAVPLHDPTVLSACVPYDFDKYFDDFDHNRLPYPWPDYDVMLWGINKKGIFTNIYATDELEMYKI